MMPVEESLCCRTSERAEVSARGKYGRSLKKTRSKGHEAGNRSPVFWTELVAKYQVSRENLKMEQDGNFSKFCSFELLS